MGYPPFGLYGAGVDRGRLLLLNTRYNGVEYVSSRLYGAGYKKLPSKRLTISQIGTSIPYLYQVSQQIVIQTVKAQGERNSVNLLITSKLISSFIPLVAIELCALIAKRIKSRNGSSQIQILQ